MLGLGFGVRVKVGVVLSWCCVAFTILTIFVMLR